MSKYIRIKDEIFDTILDTSKLDGETDKFYYKYDKCGCRFDFVYYKKDIIKESDNIEELCDKFVTIFNTTNSIYKGFEPKQNIFLDDAVKALEKWDKKYNPQIYGAIWADKGLIYVAKMCKNGKWRLL